VVPGEFVKKIKNMENFLFSIIVPIYNVDLYLEECLNSICKQTYTNFEVILVDDGSTDKSGAICDMYVKRDQRFRVIHKKNGGLVSARQAGVTEAKGDYIVCVDGDDWISLNYLLMFKEEIENNHPDIICCGHIISDGLDNKKVLLSNENRYYTKEEIRREIYPSLIQTEKAEYFSPSLWAKAFKSNLYYQQQQHVDINISVGEDGACTIPCIFYAESMSLISECLYYYRTNFLSITKNKKPFRWDGPARVSRHLEKQLDLSRGDFQDQIYRKTVHDLFAVIVTQFYRDENLKEIKRDINRHLAEPYYAKAITECRFKGSVKAKMMHYAVKYKMFWLIKIYAKNKGR
jgi:Glycosyltransferases involved in cell wall biogenesis